MVGVLSPFGSMSAIGVGMNAGAGRETAWVLAVGGAVPAAFARAGSIRVASLPTGAPTGAPNGAPFDGPNAGNASARPSGAAGSPLRSDLKKSSPSSSGSSKASGRQSSMSGETVGTVRVTGPSARGGPPVPRPELPPTVSEEKRLRGIGIVLSGRECKLRANPHDIRGSALKQGGSRSATLVFG